MKCQGYFRGLFFVPKMQQLPKYFLFRVTYCVIYGKEVK